MWSVQRLCKLEVVLLSSMTFFFGVTLTYFTVYYAGYGVDKCRESPTLYYKDGELRWPRKVDKDEFPTPDPDRDKKRKDQDKSEALDMRKQEQLSYLSATMLHGVSPLSPSTTNPLPLTKNDSNSSLDFDSDSNNFTNESSTSSSLPTIFAITPTYARPSQCVDLTSLCHTLMHVPKLVWIVVEDSERKTELVTYLLTKCKSVIIVHMNVKVPSPPLSAYKEKKITPARGVAQRNAGLSWIRNHCNSSKSGCKGVVYFMDDDNKYDLRLFEEIRKTKSVSVFPVGFAGGLKFEGPICENGKATSWHASFAPERSIPIDMAGFAISVDEILKKPNAVIGKDKDGNIIRRLEPYFLEQFTTRETAECLGKKMVMVWHVKTRVSLENEKKNPSDPRYIV